MTTTTPAPPGHFGHPFREPYLFKFAKDALLVVPGTGAQCTLWELTPRLREGAKDRVIVYDRRAELRTEDAGEGKTEVQLLLAALLLLGGGGVEMERVEVDARLQRARIKNGKPPLPSFIKVKISASYVTALAPTRQGSSGDGVRGSGHHTSPRGHLRRAHARQLRSGRTVWVKDAKVNLQDPDAPAGRAFYRSGGAA
jgi:hypothetical protein